MRVSNRSPVLLLLTGGPHFENHSFCFTVSTSQSQLQPLVFSFVIFGVNVSGSTGRGAPPGPLLDLALTPQLHFLLQESQKTGCSETSYEALGIKSTSNTHR